MVVARLITKEGFVDGEGGWGRGLVDTKRGVDFWKKNDLFYCEWYDVVSLEQIMSCFG